ncbi:MAG: hypothetical protein P9X24_18305 [Candidatus Hatepunaea meridiana]|nr:hypothetical protein [Candidatus Hatepunaea meridiana]
MRRLISFNNSAKPAISGNSDLIKDSPENRTVRRSNMILLLVMCGLLGMTSVVQAQPSITVDPNEINFGDVAVGQSGQETVTVTNTGDSDLEIDIEVFFGGGGEKARRREEGKK